MGFSTSMDTAVACCPLAETLVRLPLRDLQNKSAISDLVTRFKYPAYTDCFVFIIDPLSSNQCLYVNMEDTRAIYIYTNIHISSMGTEVHKN